MTQRPFLLLAALALSGCGGTANRGLESVHQPVVSRTEMAFDLSAPGGVLAPGEAARLDGWLQSLRVGYGDRVAVDDGRGPSAAAGSHAPGSAGAFAAIGEVLARYGLLVAEQPPVTPSPVTPGTVRVVVSRASAAVPGCPDWSRNLTSDFGGNAHSNYGCASNANLAAMVADPADLVRGQRGPGVTDAAASFKAIDRYRAATPTAGSGLQSATAAAGGKK